MTTYRTVYKCRLCGQRVIGDYIEYDGKGLMVGEVREVPFILSASVDREPLNHGCYGGDVGVADFLGYERVEKDG